MLETIVHTFFIFLFIFFVIVLFNYISDDVKAYEKDVEQALKDQGFELISIELPFPFTNGPFPTFEITRFKHHVFVMGMSGQKACYRIVLYKNQEGIECKAGLKIIVDGFTIREMIWKPILPDRE